jgi:hypothetical protein
MKSSAALCAGLLCALAPVLGNAGSIEGRIVDASEGAPLAHVSVTAYRVETNPRGATFTSHPFTDFTETDEEGLFFLDLLAAGEYSLRFFSPNIIPQRSTVRLEEEDEIVLDDVALVRRPYYITDARVVPVDLFTLGGRGRIVAQVVSQAPATSRLTFWASLDISATNADEFFGCNAVLDIEGAQARIRIKPGTNEVTLPVHVPVPLPGQAKTLHVNGGFSKWTPAMPRYQTSLSVTRMVFTNRTTLPVITNWVGITNWPDFIATGHLDHVWLRPTNSPPFVILPRPPVTNSPPIVILPRPPVTNSPPIVILPRPPVTNSPPIVILPRPPVTNSPPILVISNRPPWITFTP